MIVAFAITSFFGASYCTLHTWILHSSHLDIALGLKLWLCCQYI